MDASERGRRLEKLADLIERDQAYLAVSIFWGGGRGGGRFGWEGGPVVTW